MKLASTAAAALALGLIAGAAQAQPPDQHDNHARQNQARPAAQPAARPNPNVGYHAAGQTGQNAYRGAAPNQGMFRSSQYGAGQYGAQHGGQYNAYRGGSNVQAYGGAQQHGNVYGRTNAYGGAYAGGQNRAYYHGGNLPHQFQAEHRYRMAPRYYPQGWYARRWAYGQTLPWGWFGPQFYLSWQNYGLPAPPPGTEWVQEGSDAVLVDISTGEVLSVEYGVFWW